MVFVTFYGHCFQNIEIGQIYRLAIYTNTRFLRTPQKSARIISLQKAVRFKNRKLKQLRMRLNNILDNNGMVVADDLSCDIVKVVDST